MIPLRRTAWPAMLAIGCLASACSDDRRSPIAPPTPGGPQGPTTQSYKLHVLVQARDFSPVNAARVEVVGGEGHENSLGAFCVTDQEGRCALPALFTKLPTPRLKATRDGFIDSTLMGSNHIEGPDIHRTIRLTSTTVGLFEGEYVLRLTGSLSCLLSEDLQTITVNATVVQRNDDISLLPEGNVCEYACYYGGVSGESIGLISDPDSGGVLKIEGKERVLIAQGMLRATRSGSILTGRLDGFMGLGKPYGWSYAPDVGCRASDHSFTLTPR